jgi:Uma2 family endonuclease
MVAIQKVPHRMTVAEFLDWNPEGGTGALWQLRDGEPEMMAPASDAHGSIQSELLRLIENHLVSRGSGCRSVVTPGVVPRVRSDRNMLIPDLGITCSPPSGSKSLPDPAVLVEVLSPSNEAETRANVWAYTTIPSVREILIVFSTEIAAEILRRQANGSWPDQPEVIGPDEELRLEAIGFTAPLRDAYRTSGIR